MDIIKRIKPGYGYWDTTKYPLGGCFGRAGKDGVNIVKVMRSLNDYPGLSSKGCDEEGLTDDRRRVCYSTEHTETAVPVQDLAEMEACLKSGGLLKPSLQ